MEEEKDEKLLKSINTLNNALTDYSNKQGGELPFLTVCKALEICVEYSWKNLKKDVEQQGLMAPSPREAIRQAATVGLIKNPERWFAVLIARNDSVHDYFGIPEDKYVALALEFVELASQTFRANI